VSLAFQPYCRVSLSTSRYAGRETMEARAACVRAVKLPSIPRQA
jgi:hypothetical protein